MSCHYSADAAAPDGADPVLYFLNESHAGSSTQFASATVVLCRMLGLPARYVVGYAAPQSLFTAQGGRQLPCCFCRMTTRTHGLRSILPAGLDAAGSDAGMAAELTEGELSADTPLAGQNAANEDDAPLPTQNETRKPLTVHPGIRHCCGFAGNFVAGRAGDSRGSPCAPHTAADRAGGVPRALYRKMRALRAGEDVSSDEAAFAEFLRRIARKQTARQFKACWLLCRRHSLHRAVYTGNSAKGCAPFAGNCRKNAQGCCA